MIGLRLGIGLRARTSIPIIPPPTYDYLLDSSGQGLTDSSGTPLWVTPTQDFPTN